MEQRAHKSEGCTFARYVSLNILSMIGVSCYILADTYFISKTAGANGITVLNLCLPLYSLVYGLGGLIGTGAAITYALDRNEERRRHYFAQAILWITLIGGCIAVLCMPAAGAILRLMGGDFTIVTLGIPYFRAAFIFSPFFMANYAFLGFVRNDGDPGLCMAATIASCLFNVVFDYIFVFPMEMGIMGAGLATGVSPIVSILLCSLHFLKKENHIRFVPGKLSLRIFSRSCRMGASTFINELASCVTTAVFNFLILGIRGNEGVAAYGIVANYAIIAVSLFNGIAQGTQPIISESFARGNHGQMRRTWIRGLATALSIAGLLYIIVWSNTTSLTNLFNSQRDSVLIELSFDGLRIYFAGFFFSGLNIFIASSLNAGHREKQATIISLARGVVLIVLCAIVLSRIFGMTGIWAAYPVAELLTFLLAVFLIAKGQHLTKPELFMRVDLEQDLPLELQ